MTPIKVRGRKSTNARDSLASLLNSSSESKRPASPALLLPTSAKKARQATKILSSIADNSIHTSPLEDLPTELLENIFFHCLNVCLPQASLTIGRKLASYHVKSQLTYKVLSSISSTDYPCALTAIFPTLREQGETQSAILRLKWMTLSFLKSLIPEYLVKTLVSELGARKIRWMGSGAVVSTDCQSLIRQYLEDNTYRLNETAWRGLPAYWELKWPLAYDISNSGSTSRRSKGDTDFETIHVGIGLLDGLITLGVPCKYTSDGYPEENKISFSRWRILDGVEGCKIPEKLLHGPWTEEKCEFLEIAIRGNASVDWIGTTSGEIAKEGFRQALEERNARAVRALLVRVGSSAPLDSFHTVFYASEDARAKNHLETSAYTDVPVHEGVGIVPTAEQARRVCNGQYDSDEITDIVSRAVSP